MPITRLYKTSDENMFSYALRVVSSLEKDLSLFTSFDPTIDVNYLTTIQTFLVTAKEKGDDTNYLYQQTHLTTQIKQTIQEARQQCMLMKSFFQQLKQLRTTNIELFSATEYKKAIFKAEDMILLLNKVYDISLFHKDKLQVVDCYAIHIEKSKNLSQALAAILSEYKQIKKKRTILAEERILIYNTLWEVVVFIREAAKRVFRKNKAQLKPYLL